MDRISDIVERCRIQQKHHQETRETTLHYVAQLRKRLPPPLNHKLNLGDFLLSGISEQDQKTFLDMIFSSLDVLQALNKLAEAGINIRLDWAMGENHIRVKEDGDIGIDIKTKIEELRTFLGIK